MDLQRPYGEKKNLKFSREILEKRSSRSESMVSGGGILWEKTFICKFSKNQKNFEVGQLQAQNQIFAL